MKEMFKTRLLSGIVLVAIAIASIIAGGYVLYGVTLVVALVGLYEFYRVFGLHKRLPGVLGYIATCVYYFVMSTGILSDNMVIVMAFLISLMFVYVFRYPKFRAKQIAEGFFGFFYVAVMLSYVYQIRMLDNGVYLTFLIFFCSWGCDTCAYCVGKLCGKHKMSPLLSPKKSVEGGIGGVVGAVILTAVYCFVLRKQMNLGTEEIILVALIAAAAALISMVGDLTASAIKRNCEVKDFGTLIPGHGGIMDRFDSVIITAPIIYYLAVLLLPLA